MRILMGLVATLGLSAGAMAYEDGYVDYDRGHRGGDPYYNGNVHVAYGEVLDVQPIYRTVHDSSARQVCWDEPVEYYQRGRSSVGSTLVGALVGGVVGSQLGSGGGRDAATVAGTLIGAAAGNDAGRRGGYATRGYEQRCEIRRDWQPAEEVAGYDVTYRYRGEIYQTRTDRHPGDSIRVRVAVDAIP